VKARREPLNSLLWALGNVALATLAFVAIYSARFTVAGLWLTILVFVGFLATIVVAIRDLWKSGTRSRGFIALLLCLPVFLFF